MKKYNYIKVIQQAYGQGWEDVSNYAANSKGKTSDMSGKFKEYPSGRKRELTALEHDEDEYRLMGYPTRVIFRKVLNQSQEA